MGMPGWGDSARVAIAHAKGGGGYKGMNIDPIGLREFLDFVTDEWEHVEPEEYDPGERPLDDPRNPG